jgi:hypothetical protein
MDPASKTPASVAFGRFRVLPHRRELLADGSPVKLGAPPVRAHRSGVIYPDLPRLTRLNSPAINADGYPIGLAKAFGLFGKRIAYARCRLNSIEAPALKTPTRKMRSRAFQG